MSSCLLIRLSKEFDGSAPSFVVLNKSVAKIGRRSEVRMDTSNSKEISKHHATIIRTDHEIGCSWTIVDNHSLNGTFVNDRKISRVLLNNNDEIVFGGGTGYLVGDKLEMSGSAECRYMFVTLAPPTKFANFVDISATKTAEDGDICPVCLERIVHYEILPCHHFFCHSCLSKWTNSCIHSWKPCTCPLCRAPYVYSQITDEDTIVTPYNIIVLSIEPFLRDLEIGSCAELMSLNVFSPWNEARKAKFWAIYSKVKHNFKRRTVFYHFIKMTINDVLDATVEQLKTASSNFHLKTSECKENLLTDVITLFFVTLSPTVTFHHNRKSLKNLSVLKLIL